MSLLGDPVFQLNLVLWLLQPLPGNASIRPVLRERGYTLDSLGRRLQPPIAARPALVKLVGSDTPVSPDVLAAPPPGGPWLVVECKRSGFGAESSTARQAMKLLVSAADLGPSLARPVGETHPGFVMYVTGLDAVEIDDEGRRKKLAMLADTLGALRKRIAAEGLNGAACGALGIIWREDGIYLWQSPWGEDPWPDVLEGVFDQPVHVIRLEPDEDPRPLYLIPLDPSVEQDSKERAFCESVLRARVGSYAIAAIGRAQIPARLVLRLDRLLSSATFGASDHWRSNSDISKVERDCRKFLQSALSPVAEACCLTAQSSPDRIELIISDEDVRRKAIDSLLRAVPTVESQPQPEAPADTDDNQLHLFNPLKPDG